MRFRYICKNKVSLFFPLMSLDRFLTAQASTYAGYTQALSEMRSGGKKSHWIWYIFPQIAGLGRSSFAQLYAIADLNEAREYLMHPILSLRLREITNVILSFPEDADPDIFMMAHIDSMKLRSSMTLFDAVSPNDIFRQVIDRFYGGNLDMHTIELLDNH